MADRIFLFTGGDPSTVALELALDTDNLQLLVPGSEIGTIETDDIWHSSPWKDGEDLVRHRVKNREWPMRLRVGNKGSSSEADDLADAVTEFNRLIAQARRYHTHGDVDKVSLYIKLDGATVPTYYDVITANPSGVSLMDILYRKRGDAEVAFTLITEPYGYGDEETLVNYLINPHFEEDENGDGLANGWNKSGTPTTTLNTNIYLCGSRSQKVVTDASGTEGISSDAVSTVGSYFLAYAWVYVSSGDEVTLSVIGNASGTIGTATYSSSTTTKIGNNGNTWRRLLVSGTKGGSDSTLTISIERLSGNAHAATTFYVDQCYLETRSSSISVPRAWASYYHVGPFHDGSDNNLYIDICDIPGDVASLVSIQVESHPIEWWRKLYLSASFIDVCTTRVWEVEDWGTTSGTWATNDPDNNASLLKSVTLSSSTGYREPTAGAYSARDGLAGKFKVLVRYKKSASEDSWTCELRIDEPRSAEGAIISASTSGTLDANSTYYCLADIGTIVITPTENMLDEYISFTPRITLTRNSGSGTITIDCIYLLPTDNWMTYSDFQIDLVSDAQRLVVQNIVPYPAAYMNNTEFSPTGIAGCAIIGNIGGFMPGYLNRLYVLGAGEYGRHHYNQKYQVFISYVPRTTFLLGSK